MVMAKGVEDCAFYRYLAAHLADRGRRRPGEFAIAVDEFHAAMADAAARLARTR